MRADEAKVFLQRKADEADANSDPVEATAFREAAKLIENAEIEVVEQGILFPKSPTIPDGASWSDIGEFKGYFSGIRPTKGEPIIEQRGHLIMMRQAELSFTPRHGPIYELASSARTPDGGTVAVAVVFGFRGERSGIVWFRNGDQGPLEPLSGGQDLHEALEAQLRWMVANAVVPDGRNRTAKPIQTEIA